MSIKTDLIQPLLNWLYPAACLLCDGKLSESERMICDSCWTKLPRAVDQSIQHLWLAREKKSSIYLDDFYACFHFDDSVQKIVHGLKYEGKTKLAKEIIQATLPEILKYPQLSACDWIIPVPLHPKKKKSRGFNQSLLLASELGHFLAIPIAESILIRRKFTASQTKLDAKARMENVAEAFEVIKPEVVQNTHVLLLDDLITTGATVNECARVLKAAGAKKVLALAIARP